jgi:multidrug efflux pump subunit AcrA (membrane-fusion protein)
MLRSKWVVLLASLAIGGWGYWYFFVGKSGVSASTNQVVRVSLGSISSSVKTTGKISPIQTTSLPFVKQGTITKIQKNVGDEVKSGEILAEIDTQNANMDIRNAQISLDNAKNNYDKLFSSMSEADKLRAKTTYDESKHSLELLESQYLDFLTDQKNTLAETESALALLSEKVKLAESELEYAKKNTAINNDSTNLERDMANAFLALEEINRFFPDTIKSLRDWLYIENKNSDYYGDLWANNANQKADTEKLFSTVSGSIIDFGKSLSLLRTKENKTLDEVFASLTSAKDILTDLNTLSAMAIEEYENSRINITISQSFIDSQQILIRTLGSSISNKLSSLNGTYTTLKNYGTDEIQALANKNTVSQKEQSLQSTKNDLAKAERSYRALLTSQSTDRVAKQNEIVRQKNTVDLNELTYKELLAWPESTDLRSAKNSISSAEINLTKAYIALKDYQIIAPFDGTINDIPWIVGDTTTGSEGILIENKNMYEINLSLDQVDIVKIKPGMRANITLDAFPGEMYTGSVASISALPTETSWVVSYEAKIILTLPRTDVFSKMNATVEILTIQKENVLIIPTSAIISEWGKTYINKAKDPTIFNRLANENRPLWFTGSEKSFSGEVGNRTRGTGEFSSGSGRSFGAGSGTMMGTGISLSGSMRNRPTGMIRSGWRSPSTPLSTTEDVPSEKWEITIGLSSDGSTEVVSGLSLGDVVVIQTSANTPRAGTSSSTSSNRAPGGGFGWGRPPGF